MIKKKFVTLLIVFSVFFYSSKLIATNDLSAEEKPSQDVQLVVDCGPGLHMCNCEKPGISPSHSHTNLADDNVCNLITHNVHYCALGGVTCQCNKEVN